MKQNYQFTLLLLLSVFFSTISAFAQQQIVLEHYVKPSATTKVSQDLKQLQLGGTPLDKFTNKSIKARKSIQQATPEDFMIPNTIQEFDGYVVIDAFAKPNKIKKLTKDLKKLGLKDALTFKARISGLLPVDKVDELEHISALRYVRPSYKPFTSAGDITSRGDDALKTNQVRKKTGFAGRGIKVGILSDSYNNVGGAVDGVASDDLPENVQIIKDLPEGGSDEGRAMAEIVHDVASRSDLAFHTAFISELDFAKGIERLADAGCDVIVDDVIYLAEPMFQNGVIAQAVDRVFRSGTTYLSSAGNNGRQSYENGFNNLGFQIADAEGNILGYPHNFEGGDIYQDFVLPAGSSLTLSFQWSDPFYSVSGKEGAQTDLDIYLVLPELDLVLPVATDNLGMDPVELFGIQNPFEEDLKVQLLIVKKAGPDPELIKYVNFGVGYELKEYDTQSSTIYGHADTNGAIAVGATAWFNTPMFNERLSKPVINGFSSAGGTLHLFDNKGNKIERPYARQKPEVVGPDGGNTTFFGSDLPFEVPGTDEPDGFPNFFGTSASAPHVAGVAAIMLEATFNSISPRDVEHALIGSTDDMDDPTTQGFDTGFDYGTGYGFVRADLALGIALELLPDLEAIVPVFEGIYFDRETGKYEAYFGYNNKNERRFKIPVGPNNRFKGKSVNRGQVTTFYPGRQIASFSVTLKEDETIIWSLKGPDLRRRNISVTASPDSPVARMDASGKVMAKEKEAVESSLSTVNVYPNYSDGRFNLNVGAAEGADVWIGIYDNFGNQLYQAQGKSGMNKSPDLSKHGKGMYTVIVNVDNMLTTRKVIVR